MSALGLSAAAPASARLSVSAEPAHLRLRGGRTIPSAWKPTPLLLTSSRSAAASRRASLPIRASAAAGAEGAAGDAAGSAAQGGMTYKDAGVDIDAGAELVRRIAKMTPGIGGFGGLYPFGDHYLVAGTDGVGTKLKLAFAMDKHDTIGIDLVAMSVNDIITSGASPLFFLDYFASSKLEVDQAEQGCSKREVATLALSSSSTTFYFHKLEVDQAKAGHQGDRGRMQAVRLCAAAATCTCAYHSPLLAITPHHPHHPITPIAPIAPTIRSSRELWTNASSEDCVRMHTGETVCAAAADGAPVCVCMQYTCGNLPSLLSVISLPPPPPHQVIKGIVGRLQAVRLCAAGRGGAWEMQKRGAGVGGEGGRGGTAGAVASGRGAVGPESSQDLPSTSSHFSSFSSTNQTAEMPGFYADKEYDLSGFGSGACEDSLNLLSISSPVFSTNQTAEMPGFYADKEYDLSGFAVGAVKKAELIDGSGIRKGDKIIESFNALSLLSPLRPYLFATSRVVDASGASLSDPLPGAPAGVTIGGALLELP
ncbi:unnamed protein product [Closterium sp. NIES-65]|nr:unnamed protein product [Closterium sp. NIES-65]